MHRTVAAVIGLLLAMRVDAACPDADGRAALRQQAEQAMHAGASLDMAWGQVHDAVRDCGDPEVEAEVLAEWSFAARRLGATDRGVAVERRRVELADRHDLFVHAAGARLQLALVDVARGELNAAATLLDAALDRFRRAGDLAGQARILSERSRLERRRGDYLAALRFELTGLDLRRRIEPPPEVWRSLLNLAVLYEQIELFDEARRHYAEALEDAERHGDPMQVADVLNGYAGFLNDFGAESADTALAMSERALAVWRDLGDNARVGSCLLQVGRAQLGLGHLDQAEIAFAEALALAERGRFEALRAHIEFRWGELEFARGNPTAALRRIDTARLEYERQGNRHRLIKVHGTLELVHLALGDALAAARSGREHFRLRSELLGANAMGRLGELLTNFALAEERHRGDLLRQENAVALVRLESERRLRHAGYLIAVIIVAALLLLLWRHAAVRRLYRLLSEQTRETEAQRAALTEANGRLTRLTQVDPLTGLASRSHGMERLADALAHARERGATPALLLLDLDHFKAVNDRFGHLAGDQVLQTVAQRVAELLPDDALAARVGGEEFMILLGDADHARAEMLADAIRRRVRDTRIDVGPEQVQPTVSIGLARCAGSDAASARELFAAADQALYEAKRAGRDCVRVHGAH